MSEKALEKLNAARERVLNPIQCIELDCAPGYPRPGDLIAGVVKGTCLESLPQSNPDATVSRCFGMWTWDYSAVDPADYESARPLLEIRIRALYDKGTIRFGSWG